MESIIFTIIGAIGLGLISIGILNKVRRNQNIFYISGGVGLLAYSIFLKNVIFIILQSIFILSAVYDLIKLRRKISFGKISREHKFSGKVKRRKLEVSSHEI